jgi:hypothetical protein
MNDNELDERNKIGSNPIMNDDINILNFIVNCMRQVESTLDVKKNEIQNKKKYTREDLVTMDLAATHIRETATELKHHTHKMEERIKSDSLDLYQEPLSTLKGMNIQDY